MRLVESMAGTSLFRDYFRGELKWSIALREMIKFRQRVNGKREIGQCPVGFEVSAIF